MTHYVATIDQNEEWGFEGPKPEMTKPEPGLKSIPIFQSNDTLMIYMLDDSKPIPQPLPGPYDVQIKFCRGTRTKVPLSWPFERQDFTYDPDGKRFFHRLTVKNRCKNPKECSVWSIAIGQTGKEKIDPEFQVGTGFREEPPV